MQIGTKLLEVCIIELPSIIIDDDPRKLKMVYDELLDEVLGILLGYLGQQLGFNPLGEVVKGTIQIFLYPIACKNQGCQSPTGERPRSVDWCKKGYQLMLDVHVSLALVTLLYEASHIFFDARPVVALS